MKFIINYVKTITNPRKTTFYLVLLLITLTLWIFILKPSKKQEVPQLSITSTIPYYVNVRYKQNGKFSNFPTKMMVYKYKPQTSSNFNPYLIASKLNFTKNPEIINAKMGQMVIWRNEKFTLTAEQNPMQIEYTTIPALFPELFEKRGISKDKANEIAYQFLNDNNFIFTSITANKNNVLYLKYVETGLIETNSAEESSAVKIPFNYLINGYPIITNNPIYSPINVTVSVEEKITGFQYRLYEQNLEAFKEFKLKKESEINKELKNKTAKLVYVNSKDYGYEEPEPKIPIVDILIKNVRLGYYEKGEYQEFLQPVYAFDCEATIENKENVSCLLLIPAISQ